MLDVGWRMGDVEMRNSECGMKGNGASGTPALQSAQGECADDECEFVELGKFGALPEGGAACAENEVEGVAASVMEEIDGGAEAAGEMADERGAFDVQKVGSFDELAQGEDVGKASVGIAWAVHPIAEFGFGVIEIPEWQVDAVALNKVAADILPEVGELQCRADAIGEIKEAGLVIGDVAIEHEDDAADGIRAARAVVEQLIPGFVAGDVLILFEGENEVFEWAKRQVLRADGFAELFEDRMMRFSGGAEAEFLTRELEERQSPVARGFADSLRVREIVDQTAVGVDGSKVRAEIDGHKRAENGEVFLIAGSGERRENERLCAGIDERR